MRARVTWWQHHRLERPDHFGSSVSASTVHPAVHADTRRELSLSGHAGGDGGGPGAGGARGGGSGHDESPIGG